MIQIVLYTVNIKNIFLRKSFAVGTMHVIHQAGLYRNPSCREILALLEQHMNQGLKYIGIFGRALDCYHSLQLNSEGVKSGVK